MKDRFTCFSLITPGLLQHTSYLAEPKIYKSTPDCRRSKLSCQACTTRRWDHINLVLASLQGLQVCFRVQDCSDNFKIPSWFTSVLRLVPFILIRTLPSSGKGHLFILLAQLKSKGERTFATGPRQRILLENLFGFYFRIFTSSCLSSCLFIFFTLNFYHVFISLFRCHCESLYWWWYRLQK